MSRPTYLYPARPGMLRRGTPVEPSEPLSWPDDPTCIVMPGEAEGTVIGSVLSDGTMLVAWYCNDVLEWQKAETLALDLRDVTARVHAAMPYTKIEPVGELGWAIRWREDYPPAPSYDVALRRARALSTLRRMRALDPTVTVDDAREALDVAHELSGGAA